MKFFSNVLHHDDHKGIHTGEKLNEYKECPQIFNQSPSFNECPRLHIGENQSVYKEHKNTFTSHLLWDSKKLVLERKYRSTMNERKSLDTTPSL